MDYANGTHDYILNEPIGKVHKGDEGMQESYSITLREPTMKHAKKALKLRQMTMQALTEVSEKHSQKVVDAEIAEPVEVGEKSDAEMTKDALEMKDALDLALMVSKDVDLGEFVETFFAMAEMDVKKQIAVIDDKYKFTDYHTDQFSVEEGQRLAVTYVSFFLMPSVMQGQ